ncbi:uncharacterized protein LOC134267840 [Saccostrea cucullata]|uniref:uncharacterized protein LOC134267840 n=1 Tax=Saccostrea cuccullata TaxID=36930 RepID=UPI002ED34EF8
MDGLLRYISSVMDQVPSEMESIKEKLRAVYSKVKLFNECISNKEERITIDIDSRGTILSSPIQGLSLQMWDNNSRNEHMPNLDRSLFQTSVTEVFRFTLQGKPYTVHSKNEDVILVRIQMINLKKPNGRQWLSKVCHRDIWTTIETQTKDDWIFFGIEALESFFIIESAEEMPMTIDPKGGVYKHVSDPKALIEIPKGATVERQIANVSVVLMETPSFLGFTMISKIVRTSAHFLKPVTVHFPETIQSTDSNLAFFHFDIIHEELTIDFTHTIRQEGGCFIAPVSEFSETGIVAVPKSYSQQSGSFILPSHEYKQNRKMEFKCKALTYVSKEREDFAQLWCEVVLVDNIDKRRTMMKINNSEFKELKESNDLFLKEDDRIRVNVTGNFNSNRQKQFNIIRFNVSTDNHIILALEKTGRGLTFSEISYEKCMGKDKYLWKMPTDIASMKKTGTRSLQRQQTREGFDPGEFKSFLQAYGLENLIETFIENNITGLKAFLDLNEEDLKELSVSLGHRRSCLAAIKDYKERHGK